MDWDIEDSVWRIYTWETVRMGLSNEKTYSEIKIWECKITGILAEGLINTSLLNVGYPRLTKWEYNI